MAECSTNTPDAAPHIESVPVTGVISPHVESAPVTGVISPHVESAPVGGVISPQSPGTGPSHTRSAPVGGRPEMDPDEITEQSPRLQRRVRSAQDPVHHHLLHSVDSVDVSFGVRHRPAGDRRGPVVTMVTQDSEDEQLSYAHDMDFVVMKKPENQLEAHRMANNYLFGFRKWKSHVSQRSINERSAVVKQLYKEAEQTDTVTVCTAGNVFYVVLCGWWVALMYLIVAALMMLTVVGFKYSKFCFSLAGYFIWPFGKFVHKNIQCPARLTSLPPSSDNDSLRSDTDNDNERQSLLRGSPSNYESLDSNERQSSSWQHPTIYSDTWSHKSTGYWRRVETYIWISIGLPVLTITHSVAFLLTWMPVLSIPIAKIHGKTIQKVLLLPPELLWIQPSSQSQERESGDIMMFIYQAVNVYYYKYTVDGMNVFFVNMMFFVILAISAGYMDDANRYFSQPVKFSLALLSIIPLAYYIGMGISSISAQSSYAVGAVLNATFGSIVEIILYLSALYKGMKEGSSVCYENLVKSGLVGTLLATTLLIPGLAMVVGGIKHRSQRFNPTSAGVTATLLFVSVAAVFAPSIFSQSYAMYKCDHCRLYNTTDKTQGMECRSCRSDALGVPSEDSLYRDHVMPLIYTCCTLLPLAYIIGLIYSLKTHKSTVHDTFLSEVGDTGAGHGKAQWSRVKSLVILLVSVVLMSLCAEVVTSNIEPLLGGGISVYFIGVTLLALVPDIPEIVIGIQFALQNNISLSIEVGSCIAVQVCMLQIPVIVFADLIYSNGFYLLFSDIHIWSVVIGVLLNNYVFQDGKSNYFQGSALVLTYFALIAMYFFAPNPPGDKC